MKLKLTKKCDIEVMTGKDTGESFIRTFDKDSIIDGVIDTSYYGELSHYCDVNLSNGESLLGVFKSLFKVQE